MIRIIIAVVAAVLFLIISLPIQLVLFLIGKARPEARDHASMAIVYWALRTVRRIAGTKLIVEGHEKVPTGEPVLYIANHRSIFDTIILYPLCPGFTGFMAKKEMEKYPSLNTWMRYLHCIFVDRENPKEAMRSLLTAIDEVKSGVSIAVFPEGTRNRGAEDELLPFKGGAFKIAQKTGCYIQPVVLNNTQAVLEAQFPKLRRATVLVEFLEPFKISDLPKEQQKNIDSYCRDLMIEGVRRNRKRLDTVIADGGAKKER